MKEKQRQNNQIHHFHMGSPLSSLSVQKSCQRLFPYHLRPDHDALFSQKPCLNAWNFWFRPHSHNDKGRIWGLPEIQIRQDRQ